MNGEALELGDVAHAARTITDDGPIPGGIEGEMWDEAGTRAVITLIGHVEKTQNRRDKRHRRRQIGHGGQVARTRGEAVYGFSRIILPRN